MKKMKVFYPVIVFALLAVSVVMFSGIARAGEVPDGFIGVPWGASRDQIIKTMNERGYEQLTSEVSNALDFRGDFAGVPCVHLYFNLRANSFYSGSAWGCAWSDSYQYTQKTFDRTVNELSEKYGPPQNLASITKRADHTTNSYCNGLVIPSGYANWDFVDSRLDEYSIEIRLDATSYYNMAEKVIPCRVDFFIKYRADSLRKRLEKKDY